MAATNSKLIIVMDRLPEGERKHICYKGACPFFQYEKGGDMGTICRALWNHNSICSDAPISSMCAFYDMMHPTIIETDDAEFINALQAEINDDTNN